MQAGRQAMQSSHQADVDIVQGMNALGRPQASSSGSASTASEPPSLAPLVLASSLSDDQKYAIARAHGAQARLWAQMLGIMGKLTAALIHEIGSRTYLTDEYIWEPDVLLMARISGAVARWASNQPAVVRIQLATALDLMERSPLCRLTLVNGPDSLQGSIEMTFPVDPREQAAS
jgi:hypothetical protein